MAVQSSDQIDILWKRDVYGVTTTAPASAKTGSNETIASAPPVYVTNIWAQSDQIPSPPPAVTSSIVEVFYGAARLQCTSDPTAAPNQSWLATTSHGDVTTRIGDFIQPGAFGSQYAIQVFIGDPNAGPAARILPDTTNEEFVFDYAAGVLYFANNVPAAKSATIGSGSVSVASNGIYIQVYQYVGQKGLSGGGTSGYSGTVDGGEF